MNYLQGRLLIAITGIVFSAIIVYWERDNLKGAKNTGQYHLSFFGLFYFAGGCFYG